MVPVTFLRVLGVYKHFECSKTLCKATGEMRSRSGESQITCYVIATATMLDQEVGRVEARFRSRASTVSRLPVFRSTKL